MGFTKTMKDGNEDDSHNHDDAHGHDDHVAIIGFWEGLRRAARSPRPGLGHFIGALDD